MWTGWFPEDAGAEWPTSWPAEEEQTSSVWPRSDKGWKRSARSPWELCSPDSSLSREVVISSSLQASEHRRAAT